MTTNGGCSCCAIAATSRNSPDAKASRGHQIYTFGRAKCRRPGHLMERLRGRSNDGQHLSRLPGRHYLRADVSRRNHRSEPASAVVRLATPAALAKLAFRKICQEKSSALDRDEGGDDPRGGAVVRLRPDDGADERRHLVDAIRP